MKKLILAVPLAAVLAVSMIVAPAAFASTYLDLDSKTVTIKNNSIGTNERLMVDIVTEEPFPTDGSANLVGYAIVTDTDGGADGNLDNTAVLVAHVPVDDSSFEDSTTGLHVHVLDLDVGPTGACEGHDLEVNLANSVANTGFDIDSDYSIDGNTVHIGQISTSYLASNTVVLVASFTVTPIFSDPSDISTLTNICADVVDAA